MVNSSIVMDTTHTKTRGLCRLQGSIYFQSRSAIRRARMGEYAGLWHNVFVSRDRIAANATSQGHCKRSKVTSGLAQALPSGAMARCRGCLGCAECLSSGRALTTAASVGRYAEPTPGGTTQAKPRRDSICHARLCDDGESGGSHGQATVRRETSGGKRSRRPPAVRGDVGGDKGSNVSSMPGCPGQAMFAAGPSGRTKNLKAQYRAGGRSKSPRQGLPTPGKVSSKFYKSDLTFA